MLPALAELSLLCWKEILFCSYTCFAVLPITETVLCAAYA